MFVSRDEMALRGGTSEDVKLASDGVRARVVRGSRLLVEGGHAACRFLPHQGREFPNFQWGDAANYERAASI